jgi:hypothetical protein
VYPAFWGIVVEHHHGVQRIPVEILAGELELFHDVVRGSDDVTADCLSFPT